MRNALPVFGYLWDKLSRRAFCASVIFLSGTMNSLRMDDLAITPKGIGYLMDNSLMEKIKKEVVAVISAIATKYIG